MFGYDLKTYGEAWAEIYDDPILGWPDPAPAVAFLERMARPGPMVELGVGTGRIAIPLAEHGHTVIGIDSSPRMVEKLRQKPGGDNVKVVLGDFAEVDTERDAGLIFAVGQSFLQLGSQEDQLRCLMNVATHLAPGGRFVLEALTPDLRRFRTQQDVMVSKMSVDRVLMVASIHDPVQQTISSQVFDWTAKEVRRFPNRIRYVWPSELDVMARVANMHLVGRWANWEFVRYNGGQGAWVAAYEVAGSSHHLSSMANAATAGAT